MLHAMATLLLGVLSYPFNLHKEMMLLVAAFYVGREHAQAEYRTIYTNYERKRANAPWWCGFELRAWNTKSLLDWGLPVLLAVVTLVLLK